jgi:GTPase SAR1 family protein
MDTSDGTRWAIHIQDLSLAPMLAQNQNFSYDLFEMMIKDADGIVFLYDITDERSFDVLTEHAYLLTELCRKKVASRFCGTSKRQRFGGVLVGNKIDLVERVKEMRRVGKGKAAEWASMHGCKHYEIETFRRDAVDEVVEGLMERIVKAERRDREDLDRSYEEKWREDGYDMWGKEIAPWGMYAGVDRENQKEREKGREEEQKKEKNRFSRSWLRVRDALPRLRSKDNTSTQ